MNRRTRSPTEAGPWLVAILSVQAEDLVTTCAV
jgi:hypothetical protein